MCNLSNVAKTPEVSYMPTGRQGTVVTAITYTTHVLARRRVPLSKRYPYYSR